MPLIGHLKLKFPANFLNFGWEDFIDLTQFATAVKAGTISSALNS